FVRLFLDAGEPIRALLAQRPPDAPLRAFVAHLLAAFAHGVSNPGLSPGLWASEIGLDVQSPILPAAHPVRQSPCFGGEPLVESLSTRELDVLRLMSAGLTNQEIAHRLIISVPTVNTIG